LLLSFPPYSRLLLEIGNINITWAQWEWLGPALEVKQNAAPTRTQTSISQLVAGPLPTSLLR
jgi:hypothetical protein